MRTLYYKELVEDKPILIMTNKTTSSSEHRHSFFELSYVVSGSANHTLGGKEYLMKEGDFFLVDLNSSHEYKKSPESSEIRIINCLFLPEYLDESLHSAKSFQDITDNFFIRYGYGEFSEIVTDQLFHDDTGIIGRLFKNMQSEFDGKKLGYEDIIRNHLHTIIIHLLRHHTKQDTPAEINTVMVIKEYVKKNYMKSLLLSDICRKMNFSLSYISMKFRKETGLSFREYLIKVRIEKACHLLKSSNTTIGTIAGTVGYTDPAFFYKSFRKETGLTPDEYRKNFSGN